MGLLIAQAAYFRCLATMFASGVPLDRCLSMLAVQSDRPELRQASLELAGRVLGGATLSRAMADRPELFSVMQRRLIEVGENTGALALVFARVADHEEQQFALAQKLHAATVTPALVGLFCLTLAVLAPPLLFQGLFDMLRDLGQDLPWPTRLLVNFSRLLRSPLALLMMAMPAAVGVVLRRLLGESVSARVWLRRLLLAIPGLGKILRAAALARFAQALQTGLEVGTPVLAALDLAARASGDPLLLSVMPAAQRHLRDGLDLRQALDALDYFPQAFLQALETGQESGQLGAMLASLRQLYEIELEAAFEAFSRLVEPLFIVTVGGLVGFTVLATMLPMMSVIQSL